MIIVKWIPGLFKNNVANISYFEPEPAFKYFLNKNPDAVYTKCPAFSDFLKNTFIIKSPYDLEIYFDHAGAAKTNKYGQNFFDKNITIKPNGKNSITLQTIPQYIFITNSKCPLKITCLPMILEENKYRFIGGEFDISKWIRPLFYSIEINNFPETIVLKRGQPLYMVKFTPENNDVIKLEQEVHSEDLENASNTCTNFQNFVHNKNLNYLYEISHKYISIMKKRLFK